MAALGLLLVGVVVAVAWAIPSWDVVSDSGAREAERAADGPPALTSPAAPLSEEAVIVDAGRGASSSSPVASGRVDAAQPASPERVLEPARSTRPSSPRVARAAAPSEESAPSEVTVPSEVTAPALGTVSPAGEQLEREPQPFDKGAAAAALGAAEAEVGACRAAGDPSGTARVVVTFAPSGRVTTATVSGAPFAGTPTGGCIAARFRAARVAPFAGSYMTVTKTVVVR